MSWNILALLSISHCLMLNLSLLYSICILMLSILGKTGGCRIVCWRLLLICALRVGAILGRSIGGVSRFFVLGIIGSLAFMCGIGIISKNYISNYQYILINNHKKKKIVIIKKSPFPHNRTCHQFNFFHLFMIHFMIQIW